MTRLTKSALLTGVFGTAAFALTGVALAGGANPEVGGVAGVVQTPLAKTTKSGGTLPFTGTNLLIFTAVAVALILVGLAMRRTSSDQQ